MSAGQTMMPGGIEPAVKGCPFCGHEPCAIESFTEAGEQRYFVTCGLCRACGPICEDIENAQRSWNEGEQCLAAPTPPATQTVGEGEIEAALHAYCENGLQMPNPIGLRRALTAAAKVRALSRAPADGWQPIETAPTGDDDFFLVCGVGDDRSPFVVRGTILSSARKANTPGHLHLHYLTHWMPLPALPVAKAKGGENVGTI